MPASCGVDKHDELKTVEASSAVRSDCGSFASELLLQKETTLTPQWAVGCHAWECTVVGGSNRCPDWPLFFQPSLHHHVRLKVAFTRDRLFGWHDAWQHITQHYMRLCVAYDEPMRALIRECRKNLLHSQEVYHMTAHPGPWLQQGSGYSWIKGCST